MANGHELSIVEYGVGNIGSVLHACKRAGITPNIAHDGAELGAQAPGRILLPGVGAIGEALKQLRARDFEPVLNRMVFDQKTPILGICVGMQILAEVCEEFGEHAGLGWLPGARTGRIADKGAGLRLPHETSQVYRLCIQLWSRAARNSTNFVRVSFNDNDANSGTADRLTPFRLHGGCRCCRRTLVSILNDGKCLGE